MLERPLSGGSQLQPRALPDEQFDLPLLFQLCNRYRDGGRRNVNPLGGPWMLPV